MTTCRLEGLASLEKSISVEKKGFLCNSILSSEIESEILYVGGLITFNVYHFFNKDRSAIEGVADIIVLFLK